MSKHTPGPWRVEADGILIGNENWFKPFGGCGCCGSPWMSAEKDEQQIADARLIAASPTLYEFVKKLALNGDTVAQSTLAQLGLLD